jgi:hypothetical protein
MAAFAPVSASHRIAQSLLRNHAETEQAIARIRFDASLTDRERARRITEIVAESNRRVLARASARAAS